MFCLGRDKLLHKVLHLYTHTLHTRSHTTHILSQKLLTMYSVFLASLLSSPKVSKNPSMSFCSVELRSSASARALSASTILACIAWYQCRCCTRFVFNRTTSTCSSSFLCSKLIIRASYSSRCLTICCWRLVRRLRSALAEGSAWGTGGGTLGDQGECSCCWA